MWTNERNLIRFAGVVWEGGWVPVGRAYLGEDGFQVRSGWPGWARRDWMGWSWVGWLRHSPKLTLKCCGFLAYILAEFMRTDRSWGLGPGVRPGPASLIAE